MRPLNVIPLPEVTRVHTDHGSHIEPPLDQDAPAEERLAWHAAVVAADSGVPIKLHRYGGSPFYSIAARNSSIGEYSFSEAWTFLNGVCFGAQQAKAGEA